MQTCSLFRFLFRFSTALTNQTIRIANWLVIYEARNLHCGILRRLENYLRIIYTILLCEVHLENTEKVFGLELRHFMTWIFKLFLRPGPLPFPRFARLLLHILCSQLRDICRRRGNSCSTLQFLFLQGWLIRCCFLHAWDHRHEWLIQRKKS